MPKTLAILILNIKFLNNFLPSLSKHCSDNDFGGNSLFRF